VLDQPLRSGSRDGVEGGTHRLTYEFQTVEATDCARTWVNVIKLEDVKVLIEQHGD
jgi:hypothetical protein